MPRSLNATTARLPGPRSFTNREQEQQSFRRLLELPAGQPLPVLMFCGSAGIGKSWLLRKLRADLPAGLPSALLDFEPQLGEVPYPADQARALAELRQQFGDVECPRFDLAYSCLRFHQGDREEPFLQGGLAGAASAALAELAAGADSERSPLEVFLGRVAAHLGSSYKGSQLERWLSQKGSRQDVGRLYRMASEEIYPQLAGRFLADLAQGLPEQPGRACRGVIFLDTILALQRTSYGGHPHPHGHWLLDLHHAASPVLIVLAGRKHLPHEAWEPGDRPLVTHDLLGLPEQAAHAYLCKAGITDPALQDKVLHVSAQVEADPAGVQTAYHPFSLSLCADTLHHAPDSDPASFDTARGGVDPLVDHFLKSLASPASETLLRRLALTPRFDETAARAAYPPATETPAALAWDDVRDLSFIRSAQPGWWAVHQQVRQALSAADPDVAAADRFWHDHWRQRSAKATDVCAALAWYHRYCLNPGAAQHEWKELAQACRQAGRMVDHYWLLSWWDYTGLTAAIANSLQAADALVELAVGYCQATLGLRSENLLRAITGYEAALHWFTEAASPASWAELQHDLGLAYAELQVGNRVENLRKAIACHEAALRVHTETAYPEMWAATQDTLGTAYAQLPVGDREENLRCAIAHHQAALRVFTEAEHSDQWASVQNNLGAAHADLMSGDRAQNLRSAIACYEAALRVHAEHGQLDQWAVTQNNLGVSYRNLPSAEREPNLRKAIACYEAALGVHTEADYPAHWATAQNNLGTAYVELPSGNREDNLRRAIACFEAALRMYTEFEHPVRWGVTQNNLGTAYAELYTGDNSKDLQRAIACFEAALRTRTETDYPLQWASTQSNLGEAYAELSSGNQDKNLQKGIACHEAALRVFTEAEHSVQWAASQHFLAAAFVELSSGNRQENLRRAIAHGEAALRAVTEKTNPSDWSSIQHSLGMALEELASLTKDAQLGRRALACFEAANRGYLSCGFDEEAEALRSLTERARKKFSR